MQIEKIDLDETNCFSPLFLAYLKEDKSLKPFYQNAPRIDNFGTQIRNKSFSKSNREILRSTLLNQYQGIEASSSVISNINSLEHEKTFTITTGHQLNIFTGPLYFIYKIVTVVNTCKQLKSAYPDYNFVPVYWMASEDHDFEEINHFRLDGKKYTWNTDQKGAVGRFDPSSIKAVVDQMEGDNDLFAKAYLGSKTLAEAGRKYVNALFGDEGVVVVDADEKKLKQHFTIVMSEDIFSNDVINAVDKTTSQINECGFKTQVKVREINFFYLDGDIRSRLIFKNNRYQVLDTNISLTGEELKSLINSEPEKLSPNVILRPLYQETVLPNLAYVGGPAEIAYWLQLKGIFEHFNTPIPILMPRNFAMVIDKNTKRKIDKNKLDLASLFLPADLLLNKVVSNGSTHDLSYQEQINQLISAYGRAYSKAAQVDPTLQQHISALQAKAIHLMAKAEKKLVRAEKRHHSEKIQQVTAIKNSLFPNGSLQERTDNFLGFYHRDSQFIQKLLKSFDPFDYRFHVLIEE